MGSTNRPTRVRTPTVLQMEAVECGAAALAIILGYYRRIVPLQELRVECGVSRDGSQALSIVTAARRYGLTARGMRLDVAGLSALRCPFIVFWNFNHFIVVEGFRDDGVYINDPATGPRTISAADFDEGYTGVALALEPGPEFVPGGRRPSIVRALVSRLRGSIGAVWYCVAVGFLLVIPGLLIPALTQVFVDRVLVQRLDDWVRPLVLGLVATAVLRGALTRMQLTYLRQLRTKLAVVMSSQYLWHILRLPMHFYAQRYAGEIGSRLVLNDKVADVLSGRLATTAIDATMMLFYAVVMAVYDPVLTSVGVLFASFNFAALRWVARRREDANVRLLQESGKVTGLSIAGLQSMETLKASAIEGDFFARWSGYYAQATLAQQELAATTLNLGLLPTLLSALASMLVLVLGGLRVLDGVFTLGMLVAFQSLMQSFLAPVSNLVGLGATIQELRGDLTRLDDVLMAAPVDSHVPMVPDDREGPAHARLEGHVALEGLVFGFARGKPPLIDGLSLSLKPGEWLAIVGASGSGKSTVARLLCGLYDPWAGEIRFDGRARADLPPHVLTSSVAMVDQDLALFEGTVRENLTLWDRTVPDQSVVRACTDALIHDAVLGMPGGYDADLLEGGANLSGGQRQRLELARALISNPSILILDEATSALDAETERRVLVNLKRRGCSCVLVAHRLSAVRDCDQIVVLRQGKVVQHGVHEELSRQDGEYARLMSLEDQWSTHVEG